MCANFGKCYEGSEPGLKSVPNQYFRLSATNAKAGFKAKRMKSCSDLGMWSFIK